MAEIIKLADATGMVHYINLSQIVDVYFPVSGDAAYIITTAASEGNSSKARDITVRGTSVGELRDLLNLRAEVVGNVAMAVDEAQQNQVRLPSPPTFKGLPGGGGSRGRARGAF